MVARARKVDSGLALCRRGFRLATRGWLRARWWLRTGRTRRLRRRDLTRRHTRLQAPGRLLLRIARLGDGLRSGVLESERWPFPRAAVALQSLPQHRHRPTQKCVSKGPAKRVQDPRNRLGLPLRQPPWMRGRSRTSTLQPQLQPRPELQEPKLVRQAAGLLAPRLTRWRQKLSGPSATVAAVRPVHRSSAAVARRPKALARLARRSVPMPCPDSTLAWARPSTDGRAEARPDSPRS